MTPHPWRVRGEEKKKARCCMKLPMCEMVVTFLVGVASLWTPACRAADGVSPSTPPKPVYFNARLGFFAPSDSNCERIYGSSIPVVAAGVNLSSPQSPQFSFGVHIEVAAASGTPDTAGEGILRASCDMELVDLQLTATYKMPSENQKSVVLLGAGFSVVTLEEHVSITDTSFNTYSGSASLDAVGLHVVAGYEWLLPRGRAEAGLMLKTAKAAGAVGDVDLGGLTVYGGVSF